MISRETPKQYTHKHILRGRLKWNCLYKYICIYVNIFSKKAKEEEYKNKKKKKRGNQQKTNNKVGAPNPTIPVSTLNINGINMSGGLRLATEITGQV